MNFFLNNIKVNYSGSSIILIINEISNIEH